MPLKCRIMHFDARMEYLLACEFLKSKVRAENIIVYDEIPAA